MSDSDSSALAALRARIASLEAAAATATERLTLAIESLPDGFAFYDGDDRLVLCNSRYREIYEVSAPALIEGARFEDILRFGLERGQYAVRQGEEEAWLARRLALHRQPHTSYEQQLGCGRWIEVIEAPAPHGGRIGVRIDITERKRQASRLTDIIAAADIGTWEWNIRTGEIIVNERLTAMLGYSPAELAPITIETWQRLSHPDDWAGAWTSVQRHLVRRETPFFDCELRIRHRNGSWIWVHSRGRTASWTATGEPEWVLGTHQDISPRKGQEAATLAAKSQLEATLAAIPDLLFEIDADGRFVGCHVGGASRVIAPPEACLGRTLEEVLPPDVAAAGRAAIGEAARTGRSTGIQYRLGAPDGPRWYELSVARKTDGTAGKWHFIVLARDITERKELESRLAAERDFLEQIMATSLSAIVAIDADGQLAFANKAAERVLGVSASTATGRRFDNPAWRITGIDGGPYPLEEIPFVRVMTTGAPVFDVRHGIEWPDGTRRAISVNAAPLAESSGSIGKVVCSVTDITDRLQAEAELRQKETLLRGLFELCPVGIALTDHRTGAFLDVNDALLASCGYSREEMLTMTYFDITPEEHWTRDTRYLKELAERGHYGPFEKENIRKDGSRFPVLLSGTMVTDHTGRSLVWSIVEDITERKAAEAQIIRQAHYDALTGLPNRRLFQERLAGALERARRGRHIGAVAMLDLDDFKTVNDSLGHKAGDAILIEAASRLAACTRATDTVARFGGDEFLVLLDDIASPSDAARIAAKIQDALAGPYVIEGEVLRLGVSIGIGLFPADSADGDELIRLADMAMYRAKRHGRNLTRFHATVDF